MLARMMQMLMNDDFVEKLRAAKTPAEFLDAIDAQEDEMCIRDSVYTPQTASAATAAETSAIPQTSDDMPIVPIVVIALAALLGLVTVISFIETCIILGYHIDISR